MDLLQTVRKEGSRGGRSEFKWEDVKADQHRENYLGHSLMAPVGRWQKGRDLNWYAKSDGQNTEQSEADARKEEIKRIKEAEADAMAAALGLPVAPRNANHTPLGERASEADVKKVMGELTAGDGEGGKGLAFGEYKGKKGAEVDDIDVLKGADAADRQRPARRSDDKDRSRRERRRSRSREHRHRRRDDDDRRRHRRSRSRSRDRERQRRSRSLSKDRYREKRRRSRSRSGDRDHERHRRRRFSSRSRSRSPYERTPRSLRDRPRSPDRRSPGRRAVYDGADGQKRVDEGPRASSRDRRREYKMWRRTERY